MDLRKLKLRNSNKCSCGHEFTYNDIKPPIIQNKDYNYYGGRVKYYVEAICPDCNKKLYLLLENYNNRDKYKVIDIAEENKIQGANININASNEKKEASMPLTEKYVCKKCGKVCANKAGLAAHKRKCKA